jgi:hypothetical protein
MSLCSNTSECDEGTGVIPQLSVPYFEPVLIDEGAAERFILIILYFQRLIQHSVCHFLRLQ